MILFVSALAAPSSASMRSLLVIDDEESMRHMLGLILKRAGYVVHTAEDGEEGLVCLRENSDIQLVLCDVRMPRLDGLGFLAGLDALGRRVHTVMMSAYGSMDLAIEAMQKGASDYISKPFRNDEILLVLKKVEEREQLRHENQILREVVARPRGMSAFVGASPAVESLLAMAEQIASFPATVLIRGESGTGKEVLARCIHEHSDRKDKPFVALNCAAIPENLLESELFGHVRGAFTGAVRNKKGLFEEAHRGTILLDEIGDMPLSLQVKLLRVLETQQIRPVGSSQEKSLDVRVLAATASDLESSVSTGTFREDLFYRLNVVQIRIPALRDRPEDIPLLVAHFLALQSATLGRPCPSLSPEVHDALQGYSWPGNVRQLQNAIERAVLLSRGIEVVLDDLPPAVFSDTSSASEDLSFKRRIPALEKHLIQEALERSGGNRTQAAKCLEISYKALLYKIRDYELEQS